MRLLFTIIATSAFLLISCSRPDQVETATQAGSQTKWRVQNVDSASARKLMAENPQIGVLDVRTPAEFAEGHIEGAINVDFKAADFAQKVAKLDKNKTYVVHCRSGNRSTKSLPVLEKNNFGTIYHLNKGFNSWQAAGMPTVR